MYRLTKSQKWYWRFLGQHIYLPFLFTTVRPIIDIDTIRDLAADLAQAAPAGRGGVLSRHDWCDYTFAALDVCSYGHIAELVPLNPPTTTEKIIFYGGKVRSRHMKHVLESDACLQLFYFGYRAVIPLMFMPAAKVVRLCRSEKHVIECCCSLDCGLRLRRWRRSIWLLCLPSATSWSMCVLTIS